jgi:hypothetical protein
MGPEGLFRDALAHAAPAFALGERLDALRGDLAMIEGETGLFGVTAFAAAGKCTLAPRAGMYHQVDTEWDADDGIVASPKTTWLDVAWEGHDLQVVKLAYPSRSYGEDRRHYILARTREIATAFLAAVCAWNHEIRGEILVYRDGCFQKSTKLYAAIQAASFDQLILEGALVSQIRDDFAQFLAARPTYAEHRVPWRRGVLFVGPPGNGKTLCVKALVRDLRLPCIYVQSFEAQHATPQHAMEEVFERARATAPCLLVLEDIDSLVTEASRSFFLNELDGFAANTGIITIATTNHAERLDPSIVERPSRFDRKYHFELPSAPTRAAYVALWNARLHAQMQLSELGRARVVELTDGFSFAYIQEVFVASALRWVASPDPAGLLQVAVEQIAQLRAQMATSAGK